MLPMPPELSQEDTQHSPDGELFYIVKNGIRMSGMPAFGPDHSEKDLWNMVTVIRHLNSLSADQQQNLEQAAAAFGHHAAGAHEGTSGQ